MARVRTPTKGGVAVGLLRKILCRHRWKLDGESLCYSCCGARVREEFWRCRKCGKYFVFKARVG